MLKLIDAHGPSGCSPSHCGMIKVSAEAQRNPRAHFAKSVAQFGITAEELPRTVEDAMAELDRRRPAAADDEGRIVT